MQAALLFEAAKIDKLIYANNLVLDAENANWLLRAPGMPALAAISNDLRASFTWKLIGMRFVEHREFTDQQLGLWQPYASISRALIPDDAVTEGYAIGIESYYLPDLTIVDHFGLTDAVVARNPVVKPNQERHMAHDREPPPGYLNERGVNFTVRPPANTLYDALNADAGYAVQAGPNLWMPFNALDQQWVLRHFGPEVGLLPNRGNAIDRAATLIDRSPAIRATYDVYHIDDNLIYVRDDCTSADVTDDFLLHIIPHDPTDLPSARQQWGFDNLDFEIRNHATYDAGACVAAIPLPSYPIATIKTGQYNADGVRLWEGEIRLEPQ